jgi:hypothetical protein
VTGEREASRKRNLENSELSPVNFILFEEIVMKVQKSKFDEKWKVIRDQSVEWFSLLGEHDLKKIDKAADKQDKFLTMLQVKYGYTRQQATEEVNRRWAAFYRAKSKIGA